MANMNHRVGVTVSVTDNATNPLSRISRQMQKMSRDFSSISATLGTFANTLNSSIRNMDRMANSLYRFNMYTSSIQRNMRNVAMIGVGAASYMGVQSTNRAIDYDFKIAKMQTRMGASDAVRQDISDFILNDLNLRVSYRPTDIADLGIIFGQSGIKRADDMKTLLGAATYFSEAVDAIPEEAGRMIITAANGFDLSLQNASEVTDKLAFALHNSLLTVEELPHMLGQVSGRAKMYGQSLESTLIAVMTARDMGMPAAQASQNLLHGLGQLSLGGNLELLWPKRRSYFEQLGIDDSFFDLEKRQLKEFPYLIQAFEESMAKQGFMPERDEMYRMIEENDGRIPDGLFDRMESSALVARVLGRAGMTPIIMGMAARHEEVDPQTGLPTGKVYYGSDALIKIYEDMRKAEGYVDEAHSVMLRTAQRQLEILGGAWEATQIKYLENILPAIRSGAIELTNLLGGDVTESLEVLGYDFEKGTTALDRWSRSVKESANNMREMSPFLGDVVETIGDFSVSAIRIGEATIPTFRQANKAAYDNITSANWGESLWSLPYYAVKNGFGFIMDIVAENEEASAAIANLPEELQQHGELTRKMIQGGLVLAASGAIIKILELAIRAASVTLKGTRGAVLLGKAIIDLITGTISDKGVKDAIKSTMTVNANVVNVYGKTINDGGDGDVIVGGDGKKDKKSKGGKNKPLIGPWGWVALGAGSYYIGGAISDRVREMREEKVDSLEAAYLGREHLLKNRNLYGPDMDIIMGRVSNNKIGGLPKNNISKDDMDILKQVLIDINTESINSTITNSFNEQNRKLENVKIENRNNIEVKPNIILSGELKDSIKNVEVKTEYDNYMEVFNSYLYKQNRRYPDR